MILFGHCAGAIIAYEMAQQLVRVGHPPAGLVLVDPEYSPELAPYLYNSGMKLSLLQSSWRKRAAGLDEAIAEDPNPDGDLRRKLVAGGIKHAIGTYIPEPYNHPTLLIYTPERRNALLNREHGYPTFVRDLETVALTTNHEGMFTAGLPQVGERCRQLHCPPHRLTPAKPETTGEPLRAHWVSGGIPAGEDRD